LAPRRPDDCLREALRACNCLSPLFGIAFGMPWLQRPPSPAQSLPATEYQASLAPVQTEGEGQVQTDFF
jgi:hypothetical protein